MYDSSGTIDNLVNDGRGVDAVRQGQGGWRRAQRSAAFDSITPATD